MTVYPWSIQDEPQCSLQGLRHDECVVAIFAEPFLQRLPFSVVLWLYCNFAKLETGFRLSECRRITHSLARPPLLPPRQTTLFKHVGALDSFSHHYVTGRKSPVPALSEFTILHNAAMGKCFPGRASRVGHLHLRRQQRHPKKGGANGMGVRGRLTLGAPHLAWRPLSMYTAAQGVHQCRTTRKPCYRLFALFTKGNVYTMSGSCGSSSRATLDFMNTSSGRVL